MAVNSSEYEILISAGLNKKQSANNIKKDITTIQKQLADVRIHATLDQANIAKIKSQLSKTAQALQIEPTQLKQFEVLNLTVNKFGQEVAKIATQYEDKFGRMVKVTQELNLSNENFTKKAKLSYKEVLFETSKYEDKIEDIAANMNMISNHILPKFSLGKNEANQASQAMKDFNVQLERMRDAKSRNATEKEFKDITYQAQRAQTALKRVSNEARVAGKWGMNFFEKMKQAFVGFSLWSIVTTTFMQIKKAIVEAFKASIEFEKALIDLNKVANLTNETLKEVGQSAFELSKQFGQSGKQAVAIIAEFKKAGFSIEESMDLARTSMELMNVGEVTLTESTGALISALENYNLTASESVQVSDKLNKVSNETSATVQGLANGLQRSAGTLAQTGTSIDENLGLLVSGFTTLRNMEKVSTGLITISTRLRKVGEGAEDAQEYAPKLEEDFRKIGLSLVDSNGEFKDTYEILQDLSEVYPRLNSMQKANINFLVAGTRQAPVLTAILNDFALANEAVAHSLNAQGSSFIENLEQMEATSNKIAQMKSAWEEFTTVVANTSRIRVSVESLKTSIEEITGIIRGEGLGASSGIQQDALGLMVDNLNKLDQGSEEYLILLEKINEATDKYFSESNTAGLAGVAVKAEMLEGLRRATNEYNSSVKQLTRSEAGEIKISDEVVASEKENLAIQKKIITGIIEENEGYFDALYVTGQLTDGLKLLYQQYKLTLSLNMTEEIINETRARKQNNDAVEESIELETEATTTKEDYLEALENTISAVDSFQSANDSLADTYTAINNGEKISITNMIDMIQKYPEMAFEIMKINDSKQKGIGITKALFEINKANAIAELHTAKAQILALQKLSEVEVDLLQIQAEKAGIIWSNSSALGDYGTELTNVEAQLALISELTLDTVVTQKNWNTEIADTETEIRDLTDAIDAVNESLDDYEDKIKDALEDEKDHLQDVIDDYKEYYKDRIDGIDDILDGRKEELEITKEQVELEEKIKELAEARENLANVKKERNTAILENGVWVWQANPEELRKAQDALTSAQDAYNTTVEDNEYNSETRRLETKKAFLEKERDAEIAVVENTIEEIERNLDELSNIESDNYIERLNLLKKFVSDYNLELTKMQYGQAVSVSSPTVTLKKDDVLNAMEANSKAWFDASDSDKKSLAKVNEEMGASIGLTKKNGNWFDSNGNQAFAEGGVNDYTGTAQLHGTPTKPELVLNNQQAGFLYNMLKDGAQSINSMLKSPISSTDSGSNSIHIASLSLPNVTNWSSFKDAMEQEISKY